MKKQKFLIIAVLSLFCYRLYSETPENKSELNLPDTTQLLLSYIENDTELKNLTIAAKKAALSYDATKIDNGFDISLASGNVTIKLSEDGTSIYASPSAKVKLPQASNLSAQVTTSVNYSENSTSISDTSLALGVDILSTSTLSNKISLMKAERSVIEAERKLGKRVLNAEKEFYTELKKLLTSINSIMTAKENLYSDKIDFEAVKIQGYSKASSTYRKAELKVITDQHDIEASLHTLIHDCVVFYKKCGFDIQIDDNTDLMSLVPSDIEAGTPLNILDFEKENYTSIESATWTYKINSMERSTNKNYSLSASAGYTFDNSSTNSDSIDAGLSGSIGGLSLGAGVSIPVGAASNYPAITLSMSLNPNTFRKNSITKQQNSLTEEQELLAITAAETEYETLVVETQQKLDSLLWEEKSLEENVSLYAELEKDMSVLYKQGFTSESEYLSAQTNLNSYIIKKVINQIELIMYNDDVVMNFIPKEN